jgi:spore germination protein YaaH
LNPVIYSTSTFGQSVLDFYGNIPSGGSGSGWCDANVGLGSSSNNGNNAAYVGYNCGIYGLVTSNSGASANWVSGLTFGSNELYSIYFPSSTPSSISAQVNYGSQITSSTDMPTLPQPILFNDQANTGLTYTVQYVRVRVAPPNNVMPGVNFSPATGGPRGGRESLLWVPNSNMQSNLDNYVYNNPSSFTILAPSLYTIDSNTGVFEADSSVSGYSGGVPQANADIRNHGLVDTPIIAAVTQTCSGCTSFDPGIETLLKNQNNNIQNFINAAISAAAFTYNGQNYKLQGYNIDFEPSTSVNCGSGCSISQEFDSFMQQFASALHQNGMQLSVDVAPWNMIQSETPGSGVFWDYAGLASSVDYVTDMDYVSHFCYSQQSYPNTQNSENGCVFIGTLNPNDYQGYTFYDQWYLTTKYVPLSKAMIGVESIGCGQDFGAGSNCIGGIDVNWLVTNGISNMAIWPTEGTFLDASGLTPSPYPSNYNWINLAAAFMQDQSS